MICDVGVIPEKKVGVAECASVVNAPRPAAVLGNFGLRLVAVEIPAFADFLEIEFGPVVPPLSDRPIGGQILNSYQVRVVFGNGDAATLTVTGQFGYTGYGQL